MKLLYMGTHICPPDSLARLLVLGDELIFLDRPSVTFDDWGTIGHDSYMRGIGFPSDAPVKKSVVKPESGPARGLYESYVEADITNPAFVKAFLDGLRDDQVFAERFLSPQANYGEGRNGVAVRRLLVGDKGLYETKYDLEKGDPRLMYNPEIPEGRKMVARNLLVDASIQITSAQLAADDIEGALAVSDDTTYPRLLALRASSSRYVGGTHVLTPILGLEFARSVIPDAALRKIDFSGIFDYRRVSSDVYKAWSAEVNRCASKIADADMENPSDAVKRIVATELMPKAAEYERELSSIRDKLFGDIIKGIATWEIPTLSIAYITNMGFAGAAAAFAAGLKSVAPHVVDFVSSRRAARRKHASAYLVGLARRS